MVRYWWKKLNIAVFRGILHPPKRIEIKQIARRGMLAYCCGYGKDKVGDRHVWMCFAHKLDNRREFLNVLVHEMVHSWEHQHHAKMGHKKRFFAWQPRIERTVGLHLSELI